MLVFAQNLEVRRIIPTSNNIMRSSRDNVTTAIKLICWGRMLLIKTIFKILKSLLKLYSSSTAIVCSSKLIVISSSTAIACNSKLIVIEMDPPASLSVSVKASALLHFRTSPPPPPSPFLIDDSGGEFHAD